ncbi:hypothetical protein Gpo141_00011181 [Globisporangium polare]
MESRGSALSNAGAAMIMNRTSKMPQTLTLDHVSPATRLLEKRRQMFEVQEALDAQKEEFARREDAFHRREEGLRKKDLELQESLIKFNKFLQENESKRNRAVKRANDEIKQRLTKEQEVAKLKEHLEQLMAESEKLGNEVKKNMKYTRYLEVVQETVPEDYPEVADLVNRYHTLKETNRDLRQNQVLHEEENEIKRLEFASFQKERANEILNFNNKIASLQRELEAEELQTIRLQHEADASMRMTTQKTLALGQIVMAIGNLLQRCTSGIHGQILKHMEGSNNATAAAASQSSGGESASGSGSNSNAEPASSSTSSAGPNSSASSISEADVIQHGLKAMTDLEVVAAYMVDFTAIVQGRIDAQRAQKRSNNQSVPVVAGSLTAASVGQVADPSGSSSNNK